MLNLVTDRTQEDYVRLQRILSIKKDLRTPEEQAELDSHVSKGAYNYTDLNRVTAAMDYLNERLAGYGYQTGYQTVEVAPGRTEWEESDIPTPGLMAAYLFNVEAIRSTLEVLSATPETPESMEALTWVEANNIEQILVDVETVITSMSQIFLRAGTSWANSGGPNFYFAN